MNAEVVYARVPRRDGPPEVASPQPTPRDPIAVFRNVANIAVLVLALISGWWTFEGALLTHQRAEGLTAHAIVLSGLLATAVVLSITVAWWLMLTTFSRQRRLAHFVFAFALVAVLQTWTFGVSSLSNLVAQIGPSVLMADVEEQIAEAELVANATFRKAAAARPLVGILEAEAAAKCAQFESERDYGSLSGSGGAGAVSGTLQGLCEQTRRTAENFAGAVGRMEEREAEARATLGAMKDAMRNRIFTVLEREDAVIRLDSDLHGMLVRMGSDDFTKVLRTARDALTASIAGPVGVQPGAFGQRQADIIDALTRSVAATGEVYDTAIRQIEAVPDAPSLEPMRRADLTGLVLSRWTEHVPLAAAAIGIDLFQLFAALTIGLLAAVFRHEEK